MKSHILRSFYQRQTLVRELYFHLRRGQDDMVPAHCGKKNHPHLSTGWLLLCLFALYNLLEVFRAKLWLIKQLHSSIILFFHFSNLLFFHHSILPLFHFLTGSTDFFKGFYILYLEIVSFKLNYIF